MIFHNMNRFPLYLKTDSVVGSGDIMKVQFLDINKNLAGIMHISFTSPPTIKFLFCKKHTFNLPSEQPSDKVLKITLAKTSSPEIMIHCDDVEVFNLLLSNETCGVYQWNDIWGRIAKNIVFGTEDTATDLYSLTKPFITGKIKIIK